MATKIRLKRLGGKHDPHFRIIVIDSRSRRDGRTIEELGYYNPAKEPVLLQINHERVLHWLEVGAQPSETVKSLLKQEGVLARAAGVAPAEPAEDQVEETAEEAIEATVDEAIEADRGDEQETE